MERKELLSNLSNYTLVVAEGKIASLGPAGAVAVPDGAVRIDARGKYAMPGLIDAFTHVDDESNLILLCHDRQEYRRRPCTSSGIAGPRGS